MRDSGCRVVVARMTSVTLGRIFTSEPVPGADPRDLTVTFASIELAIDQEIQRVSGLPDHRSGASGPLARSIRLRCYASGAMLASAIAAVASATLRASRRAILME